MPKLAVYVNPQLILDAGDYWQIEGGWHVAPPKVPLFHQLREYLLNQPCPSYLGIGYSHNTIGVVALCIRFGSYLCSLLDTNAPHRLSIAGASLPQPTEYSFISDVEMHRLNLEISWNFQQLIELYQSDKRSYYDLGLY